MQLKSLIKSSLVNSNLLMLATNFAAPGVVILRYHSVQAEPEQFVDTIGSGIMHSLDEFEEQVKIIAKHFNPVSLDDIGAFLKGDKKLPKRAVAITFDDGFEDNYTVAAPVLNKYGVPATFYVLVGAIEDKNYPWYMRLRHAFFKTKKDTWTDKDEVCHTLNSARYKDVAFNKACQQCCGFTGVQQVDAVDKIEKALGIEPYSGSNNLMLKWDQIAKLRDQGHIIGSHTISHPNMAYVANPENVKKELEASKAALEKKLGGQTRHFSYPSPIMQPHWSKQTRELTSNVGYETAVTCTPGKVLAGDNPLSIKRIWTPFEKSEFLWYLCNTMIGRTL